MLRRPHSISYADRVIIALAVTLNCNISAELEQRIRRDERARVVQALRRLEIFAISREPSRRRAPLRGYASPNALEAEIRRDERLLIARELRREARISSAAGLDGDALELAAEQLDSGALQ
jgi:hypothetical protein